MLKFYSDQSLGPRSQISLRNGNGHGSAGTQIRCFAIVDLSQGSSVTYTSDTTNGDKFRINESGLYALQWLDQNSNAATMYMGFTKNQIDLTADIISLSYPEKVFMGLQSTVAGGMISYVGNFVTGDVIRCNDSGDADSGEDTVCLFTIAKVNF